MAMKVNHQKRLHSDGHQNINKIVVDLQRVDDDKALNKDKFDIELNAIRPWSIYIL